jgi:hypothetical protein
MQQCAVMPTGGPLLVGRAKNDAAGNLDPMVFWSWTVTGLLTAAQITLGVIGAAQTGRCVPSDPIPDCPYAHGLAGMGYALFVPTLVTGVLFIGLSAIVLWRFAMGRDVRGRTNEAG